MALPRRAGCDDDASPPLCLCVLAVRSGAAMVCRQAVPHWDNKGGGPPCYQMELNCNCQLLFLPDASPSVCLCVSAVRSGVVMVWSQNVLYGSYFHRCLADAGHPRREHSLRRPNSQTNRRKRGRVVAESTNEEAEIERQSV
jgi:hypothetical protein